MPVAAAVIGDPPLAAVLTGFDMTTQCSGAAVFDRRHDPELLQAQMACMGPPPRGAVGAKDVSDLQRGPGHVTRALRQTASQRLVLKLLQCLERADGVADRLGGDMRILGGGRQPGMAQQPRSHNAHFLCH